MLSEISVKQQVCDTHTHTKAVVNMVTDAGRKYLYGYKFWTGFSDVAGKA